MLVAHVIGDCPVCGGVQQFGNVFIRNGRILRGCMSCSYRDSIYLPEIKKKIIYLDQFFFSNAFKSNDPKFVEVADKIQKLVNLQVLISPYSNVHEDETHQWRGYSGKNKIDLMSFIEDAARGHEFKPHYEVELAQILKAFSLFQAGQGESFLCQEKDVLESDIHEWDDYIRLKVGRYLGDIELIRTLKEQSVRLLVDELPSWREQKNTFLQEVLIETQFAGKMYLNYYLENLKRIMDFDFNSFIDAPIQSRVVDYLIGHQSKDLPMDFRLNKVIEFFASPYFANIPHLYISTRLFARLKESVQSGAYSKRENAFRKLGGFFQDVKHIATYAPYCDAFVMDKAMAELASDSRINLEKKYNVKIFSLNNWDELIAWLDGLLSNMSNEHCVGVVEAYLKGEN